jgi:hypothetical protein
VPVEPPSEPVTREAQPRSPRAIVLRDLHRSVQVNVDLLQYNIVGDAANEPSIAIDPTNPDSMVIGWRQFDTVTSEFRQAGYAYTSDGGATWTFPGVLDPGQFRSDPVLAADSSGSFYYYSLGSGATGFFISPDGGVNWTGPISSPGGDKIWHTIDLSIDHIYALWNSQYTCCAPGTDFTRSTDGASSFGGPYVMPQHPAWGTLDVGPNGELYIVGATLDWVSHLILRSDNADDPFQTPVFSLAAPFDLGGTTDFSAPPNPGGLLGQVWVAVDRSGGPRDGYVYALGSVDPPGSDPLDVHIVRSTDGGQSWSVPVAVNDNSGSGSYQWFGTMSVSPQGRIDVVWNDTRNGPATISEVYYAYSIDGGVTFSDGLPVSPPFDSTMGYPVQHKIGDYYHMISSATDAALAYSATFNGEQDIYFLRVGDCNANERHDSIDLESMPDVNGNRILDVCESDCNGNSVPDSVDISGGTSADCNTNSIPDECDISSGLLGDCDASGVPDECEITFGLEFDQGFTVGAPDDDALRGIWIRVDPIGTGYQPEDDHTPDPANTCYVTGQGTVGGSVHEADVDLGKTTLFSPVLDLSGYVNPRIGYWRWYYNVVSKDDVFTVDVSNDGGDTWVNVETIGPGGPETDGGWFYHWFRVMDRVAPTANVMLRFVAADLYFTSTVEAAIDDLVVVDCTDCLLSAPDEVTELRLGRSSSGVAELSWSPDPVAERYDVYRGTEGDASDLECYLLGLVTTSVSDDGMVPPRGEVLFYVATAVNCAGESELGFDRSAATSCR